MSRLACSKCLETWTTDLPAGTRTACPKCGRGAKVPGEAPPPPPGYRRNGGTALNATTAAIRLTAWGIFLVFAVGSLLLIVGGNTEGGLALVARLFLGFMVCCGIDRFTVTVETAGW